jgi:hypothetical protein
MATATVKQHLTEANTSSAEQFVKHAKGFFKAESKVRGMSSHFRKLASLHKAQQMDSDDEGDDDAMDAFDSVADECDGLADAYNGLGKSFTDHAELHVKFAKELSGDVPAAMKAAGMSDADLDKLVPDAVSAILPEVPGGGRIVPRFGQRPIDTSAVEAGLEKLIITD